MSLGLKLLLNDCSSKFIFIVTLIVINYRDYFNYKIYNYLFTKFVPIYSTVIEKMIKYHGYNKLHITQLLDTILL